MANYLTDNITYGGLFLGGNSHPYNWEKIVPGDRDFTSLWIPIDEIRDQLNLFDDTSQDAYLDQLDLTARWFIEDYLGQSIFRQTFNVYYKADVLNSALISLDIPPTDNRGVSVASISYYNDSDTPRLVALSPTDYYLDPTGIKVVITNAPSNVNPNMTAPIVVNVVQDATPIADYPPIKHAGKLLITHWYNSRSEVGDTTSMKASIPFGLKALLTPYKPLVI